MWCCRETKRRVRWSRVIVRGQLLGDRPSTRRSRWIAEIRKQKAVSLAGFRFTFSAFPDGEKKKSIIPYLAVWHLCQLWYLLTLVVVSYFHPTWAASSYARNILAPSAPAMMPVL